jgi:hypothetical protein
LNVTDAPDASVAFDQVNLQWFDVVEAEAPLPVSGLKTAPAGTASFVQCAPLGTSNATEYPDALEGPLFLKANVPQKFGPSYLFVVTLNEHEPAPPLPLEPPAPPVEPLVLLEPVVLVVDPVEVQLVELPTTLVTALKLDESVE